MVPESIPRICVSMARTMLPKATCSVHHHRQHSPPQLEDHNLVRTTTAAHHRARSSNRHLRSAHLSPPPVVGAPRSHHHSLKLYRSCASAFCPSSSRVHQCHQLHPTKCTPHAKSSLLTIQTSSGYELAQQAHSPPPSLPAPTSWATRKNRCDRPRRRHSILVEGGPHRS